MKNIMCLCVLLNFLQKSFGEVNSLEWCHVALEGLDLPHYYEVLTLDDVPVYYFDSNVKGKVPVPEWLNSTTATTAFQYWNFFRSRGHFNKNILTEGLKSATQEFNLIGISSDVNLYQARCGCHPHPNGTVEIFLKNAFNGKDFLSFDTERKMLIAAVPQAYPYITRRNANRAMLESLFYFYNTSCVDAIKEFRQQNPQLRMKKDPEVKLFETRKHDFTEITCHVTGFYPRTVQVQWFESDMQPVVEGVIEGEVLPNGDGTYQTRKSLVIPAEHTDIHHYSCVVQHSSTPGTITKTWDRKKAAREHTGLHITLGFIVCLICVILLCFWIYNKHREYPVYCKQE